MNQVLAYGLVFFLAVLASIWRNRTPRPASLASWFFLTTMHIRRDQKLHFKYFLYGSAQHSSGFSACQTREGCWME